MKAIIDHSVQRMDLSRLQSDSFKIKKISHQENMMQELYFKLTEMVPQKGKMTKTELLQSVIDYIFELQDTLEADDSEREKTPLSESFQCNQMSYEVIIVNRTIY